MHTRTLAAVSQRSAVFWRILLQALSIYLAEKLKLSAQEASGCANTTTHTYIHTHFHPKLTHSQMQQCVCVHMYIIHLLPRSLHLYSAVGSCNCQRGCHSVVFISLTVKFIYVCSGELERMRTLFHLCNVTYKHTCTHT